MAIPTYTKMGDHSVPNVLVILDNLSLERTIITVSEPQFANLGDLTFSQAYLESIR